jgi:hypothetical protein
MIKKRSVMYYFFRLWRTVLFLLFLTSLLFSQESNEISYSWPSPNQWEGGNFSIPPWFAENLNYSGHEVLHFHPDYYDFGRDGFWSYNFALIVKETKTPTTEEIIEETKLYFVGLGRTLGDKKDSLLSVNTIDVKNTSDWIKKENRQYQKYILKAYDSWETGKSIMLNMRVTTWLCKNKKHRVIMYAISPQNYDHKIWKQLLSEINSFSCN